MVFIADKYKYFRGIGNIIIIDMRYKNNNLQILTSTAELDDVDNIMNIESYAFGSHHWSQDLFINEIKNKNSFYLVAKSINDYNKTIGYIGYWRIIDEGHITTLAVDVDYRRNHIADILLYNIIDNAYTKKIKWLTLEVRASNKAALNLYKKYNFNQISIRKKYYQDNNEDALILWTDNLSSIAFKKNLKDQYLSLLKYYELF